MKFLLQAIQENIKNIKIRAIALIELAEQEEVIELKSEDRKCISAQ